MKKIGLGILLAAASVQAFAQTYNAKGRGEFFANGDEQRISDVRVSFTRSTFSISLGLARGHRVEVEGTLINSPSNASRSVRVTSFDGKKANFGYGTINIERKRLEKINLSIGTGDNRILLKFKANGASDDDGSPLPGRPDGEPAKGDTSGSGTIKTGRDHDEFKKVSFNLEKNGTFRITLEGKGMRDITLRGHWSGRGNSRSLILESSSLGRSVSGSGTIQISDSGKEISRLDLDGRIDRDSLSIDFRDR